MLIYRRQEDPHYRGSLHRDELGIVDRYTSAIALPPFPIRLAEIEQFLEEQNDTRNNTNLMPF